ncbi:MAG: hypothetical protein ACHQUC_02545 [Chlamydiales bacterium]
MNRFVIRLDLDNKKVVIRLEGARVVFSVPEIQSFFSVVGVKHFDGRFYFPKDGKRFFEALFDYYFLKLYGLLYPHG